jgi:hypothetical protein
MWEESAVQGDKLGSENGANSFAIHQSAAGSRRILGDMNILAQEISFGEIPFVAIRQNDKSLPQRRHL